MQCKLCLQDLPLLKKSHIIPNFMYKELFGGKGRMASISTSDIRNMTFMQSGHYEADLLCATCDNSIISRLERYASNTIFGNNSKIKVEFFPEKGNAVPCRRYYNIDYTHLKLFFLSILWRSHISKNSFFEEIDLGEKYAEEIRQMILSNDAGDENRFETLLVEIDSKVHRPVASVVAPRKISTDGNTMYVFHIDRILYHFNVSAHNKLSMFEKGIVKKDGILDIAIVGGEFGTGYFDSFMGTKLYLYKK